MDQQGKMYGNSVAVAVGEIADDLVNKIQLQVQNLKLLLGQMSNLIWAQ